MEPGLLTLMPCSNYARKYSRTGPAEAELGKMAALGSGKYMGWQLVWVDSIWGGIGQCWG
jgi:hypothetical protein